MNVSPNTLPKNWNLKKLETGLCRWKSTDKSIFNTNSELSQNLSEKKLCHSKQQLIGYLMVYDIS